MQGRRGDDGGDNERGRHGAKQEWKGEEDEKVQEVRGSRGSAEEGGEGRDGKMAEGSRVHRGKGTASGTGALFG